MTASQITATLLTLLVTCVGTCVGIAGSLFVSNFNHRKSIEKERITLSTEKLEELYSSLVDVRIDYQSMVGQVVEILHEGKSSAREERAQERIPPLIKVSMLTDLYFPELKPCLEVLDRAKAKIGKEWAQIVSGKYRSSRPKEVDIARDEFFDLYESVDEAITDFQKRIGKVLNP